MSEIEAAGAAVWAISPDEPERLRSYREEEGIEIPLLVDAGSETIKAYGILNEKHGAVPHPTVVIVDSGGVVRFVHLDENYRRRPSASSLIEALREIASGS